MTAPAAAKRGKNMQTHRKTNRTPKLYFWRNRVIVPLVITLLGIPALWAMKVRWRRFRPKSKTFLLVANHGDSLDPVYEMLSMGRYIRFVAADYIIRSGLGGKILNFLATPIVKHREHPREELTDEMLVNLRAGVSVGLHAEGGTSLNGETRYIPRNTARLAKESGCGLVTFRSVGGYLRSPRWKRHRRRGPLFCEAVREYGAEELSAMTEEQVYEAICRDLYVNCYDEQRKAPHAYRGRALAENCEVILYLCPACRKAGRLHSSGDTLRCDCGYEVRMGEDGFFHREGPVLYEDICAWEHWQRETVPAFIDGCGDGPVFEDGGLRLTRIRDGETVHVSQNARLTLYRDRLELQWEDGSWTAMLSDIRRMEYAKRMSLLVVTGEDYFDISSETPRSPTKYIDAWRYLTGRPNLSCEGSQSEPSHCVDAEKEPVSRQAP